MLSGHVLKQFRTYFKSQVGHGWSVEGRKSRGRLLSRVSFRYLSDEWSLVLLDIDFVTEYQDHILSNIKKLTVQMLKRNIKLIKAKELLCCGKTDDKGKTGINWKTLQDVFLIWKEGIEERQLLLVWS